MMQTILLVEDHENDVFLLKRVFRKNRSDMNVQVVEDGAVAIEYLSGANEYADRELHPLPALLLMDIKMPRVSGLEVLEWIKKENELKMIPVVIFSSSEIENDFNRAYELGANAYVVKPVNFEELERTFRYVSDFFIRHAAQPTLVMPHPVFARVTDNLINQAPTRFVR